MVEWRKTGSDNGMKDEFRVENTKSPCSLSSCVRGKFLIRHFKKFSSAERPARCTALPFSGKQRLSRVRAGAFRGHESLSAGPRNRGSGNIIRYVCSRVSPRRRIVLALLGRHCDEGHASRHRVRPGQGLQPMQSAYALIAP